jgi:hypothetical protein
MTQATLLQAGRALFDALSSGGASFEVENTLSVWDPSDTWGDIIRAADRDGDDRLSRSDWDHFLCEVANSGTVEVEACARTLFSAIKGIAANRPAPVRPRTADVVPPAAQMLSPCDSLIRLVFERLDRRALGSIGWEDAACVYTESEWSDVLREADVNGDRRVSAAEWSAWMQRVRQRAGDDALAGELRSVADEIRAGSGAPVRSGTMPLPPPPPAAAAAAAAAASMPVISRSTSTLALKAIADAVETTRWSPEAVDRLLVRHSKKIVALLARPDAGSSPTASSSPSARSPPSFIRKSPTSAVAQKRVTASAERQPWNGGAGAVLPRRSISSAAAAVAGRHSPSPRRSPPASKSILTERHRAALAKVTAARVSSMESDAPALITVRVKSEVHGPLRVRIAPDAALLQLKRRVVEAYGMADLGYDGVYLTLEPTTTYNRHHPFVPGKEARAGPLALNPSGAYSETKALSAAGVTHGATVTVTFPPRADSARRTRARPGRRGKRLDTFDPRFDRLESEMRYVFVEPTHFVSCSLSRRGNRFFFPSKCIRVR